MSEFVSSRLHHVSVPTEARPLPMDFINTLSLSTAALPFVAATVAMIFVTYFIARNFIPRVVASLPNEWLIVIRNGEQRLAGVGLKAWVWPLESYVTFPSVLTKVSFEAMQTTKEMQGVRVSGFAVFSVLRTGDGPFRYYKYVQGSGKEMAEDNLRGMAESLMRKHVATTCLNDVLRDRESLRNSVNDEMTKTTKGWGVWLETFEIKDIQICSKSLFEDLQAEYRQDTHVKAEQLRLESAQVLAERRSAHDEAMTLLNSKTALVKVKAQADERTRRERYEGDAQLARATAAAELARQQLTIEEQKIETEQKLELARQAQRHAVQRNAAELQQHLEAASHAHQLQLRRNELAVDSEMSDRAMSKYQIDSTAEIYKLLPLKELKLHNFVAPEATSQGLASLLPGIGAISNVANDQWQQ